MKSILIGFSHFEIFIDFPLDYGELIIYGSYALRSEILVTVSDTACAVERCGAFVEDRVIGSVNT